MYACETGIRGGAYNERKNHQNGRIHIRNSLQSMYNYQPLDSKPLLPRNPTSYLEPNQPFGKNQRRPDDTAVLDSATEHSQSDQQVKSSEYIYPIEQEGRSIESVMHSCYAMLCYATNDSNQADPSNAVLYADNNNNQLVTRSKDREREGIQ